MAYLGYTTTALQPRTRYIGQLPDNGAPNYDASGNTTVGGYLRLSGSSSGYVGLQGAAAAGSTTYTLPSADGASGQFLSTNGSGVLSWSTGAQSGATLGLVRAISTNVILP